MGRVEYNSDGKKVKNGDLTILWWIKREIFQIPTKKITVTGSQIYPVHE